MSKSEAENYEVRLNALSATRARLLQKLIESKANEAARIVRQERPATAGPFRMPASGAQKRLWFIDQLDGGAAHYHLPVRVRLTGDLDCRALQAALDQLIERHESLRTVLINENGEPLQEIQRPAPFALTHHDFAALPHALREEELTRLSREELLAAFDLARGPLIRGLLVRLGAEEHILQLTLHHIIADGWSIDVLLREMAAAYEASRTGRPLTLPSLDVQYADYASWRARWMQGPELREQLAFWQEHLHGAPELLELPTDAPRPARQSHRGASFPLQLPDTLSAEVRALAKRSNLTIATILHTAWAVTLARLSGQSEIVLGTPVAGRRRAELQGVIGFFINTLAIRWRLAPDKPVTELLQHARETMLSAYAHEDVPFDRVVEELQPTRSMSYSPIFQATFAMQSAPVRLNAAGVTFSEEYVALQTSQFDLTLAMRESPGALRGHINYASDLFEAATAKRWARCFEVVLGAMIQDPATKISKLPLLDRRERHRVVEEFNATQLAYPRDRVIQELFSEQVARKPHATAVVCGGRSLTFAELNERANQLARYLRNWRVGPDVLVGLCVERGVDMIVAVLGILKAGGAYVPLDPTYPPDRLADMVEDSAPRLILTQGHLAGKLSGTKVPTVSLDAEWPVIARHVADDLDARDLGLCPDHLAYVIYTSGSTGRPKGVMIEHRNVLNLWTGLEQLYASAAHVTNVALNASFNFDASVQQIVMLLSGKALVIVPEDARRDPRVLLDFLDSQHVNAIDCTPSQIKAWIAAGLLERDTSSLRLVLVGGEAIEPDLWQRLARCARTKFFNVYGPTECTVDSTAAELTPDTRPHIGRPMGNRRVYILDSHGEVTPIGVVGEMYIGGAGVGRGYCNRPELTAERFLADPSQPATAERMYRTGDLARWRADGTIEYLGRNDGQVKIRGYRIELGEIEAQILKQAGVKATAVLAREDSPGDRRLVAYVVSADEHSVSPEHLRTMLRASLPEYMIPSAFVMLEALPLTPSGKLDRRALPAPDSSSLSMRQFEPPQGELEALLASIWQSLLGIERVGRHDNFFELGGHSLLIMQVQERLRDSKLRVAVREAFENPTLAGLAAVLSGSATPQVEVPPNLIPPDCAQINPSMLPLIDLEPEHIERITCAVPGGAANIQDIYPLAPLQEGILFHHLLDGRGGDTYVVATMLSISSRKHLDDLIAALQAVIDRHDVLRTAVLWEDLPGAVQVVLRHAVLPVDEVTLATDRSADEQISEWLRPDGQRFDLRQAPLIKLRVAADQSGSGWYACLYVHHIVCDHVTSEAVIAEVVAMLQDRRHTLPEPVPYRNHVAHTLFYTKANDPEAFFRRKLKDVDEPTAPFGLLDVHGDGSQIEEATAAFEPALGQRVRRQARLLGVSAATLFHAAWSLVVASTSARDDVVFGTLLLGRLQGGPDVRRTLGMFINTLPLRLQLSGVSVRELVTTTQRELLDLLCHEQASLAVAQRSAGIRGSAPLFTALFNYRHSTRNPDVEWDSASGIRLVSTQERTNYPVTVAVDDFADSFALKVQTDRRIDPNRLADYVRTAVQVLTDALESAPHTPALSLSVMPEDERRLVLEGFNDTRTQYPSDGLLHELFEQSVVQQPDAAAVIYEGRALSYSELNRKANKLARALIARGAGPDERVALFVDRSLEMVLGVMAAWKAGASYVPLDPSYPLERIAYMLNDSAPRVVLAQEHLRDRLPEGAHDVLAIDVSLDVNAPEGDNLDSRGLGHHSGQAAYVIYTSGSTGNPKGVMVQHQSALNLWRGLEDLYGDREKCARVALNASFNFDASVQQFLQLLSGRTLFIVPAEIRRDSDLLVKFLERHQIQGIDCTPSQLKSWIAAGLLERQRAALRTVLVGGEAIDPDMWSKLAANTQIDFYNVYGPTECTVDSTVAHINGDLNEPHIGSPMANRRVYVLDSHLKPVPLGVTGEIHIGGVGVARGYLNRPELTAERFISSPFTTGSHSRLYRTGDLGRWRPEGILEYQGRNDFQVKIRGYRIELGEIEAQLMRQPQLKEAVVLAREDVPGEKRLVAYCVPRDPASVPSADVLRESLKAVLPEYAVPSAFVVLPSFPLTQSGKLDRRALPAPDVSAFTSKPFETPEGEVEEILAGVWHEILHVARVGRHDNFFELGGHSLLILQMMERLRKAGLSVEVRCVFDHPTLSALAQLMTPQIAGSHDIPPNLIPKLAERITPDMLTLVHLEQEQIDRITRAVPGGAANIQDMYPLAPLQAGIFFHHLLDEQRGDTYVVSTVLSVDSRQTLDELIKALQHVIDRHDILRTAVFWEALPAPVQVVCRSVSLPVDEIAMDPARSLEEHIADWLRPERQRIDLRSAPPMRLEIARNPYGAGWSAILRVHHITCDHVSSEIIVGEIAQCLKGKTASLGQATPYRNHVAQALAYAGTREAEAFFRQKLADVDEPTAPFGLLDVHGDGSEAEEGVLPLDTLLAQRIRGQARRRSVSVASLFHAAWAVVVARTSGRDDVVFGTVLLGRLQAEAGMQDGLGMFINTLPLRLRLHDVTVVDLIDRTQRELVDLLGHEQASLAMAQQCSALPTSVPLFSALLNYRHSAPAAESAWASVPGVHLVAAKERTNYPIALSVDDLGEDFTLTAQTDRRVSAPRLCRYLANAVEALVDALEASPQARALDLRILPAEELEQIIVGFNATQRSWSLHNPIHHLIEQQVRLRPEAVAVTCGSHQLTYEQLNFAANRIARALAARGVQPNDRVALFLDRSVELVAAMLGTFKAGGGYVPIDVDYPQDRVAFMLRDAAPRVVITEERLRGRLPETDAQVIYLGEFRADIENDLRDGRYEPANDVSPHHLAYVIYTSGSTGVPKGVAVEHRNLTNLAAWHCEAFDLQPGTRQACAASLGFDAAVWEIWPPLTVGATVVLATPDIGKDVEALIQWWIRAPLDVSFLPTPVAEFIFNRGIRHPTLRTLLVGGDRLRYRPGAEPFTLVNNYGPTECTVVATSGTLEADRQVLHIGRPVANGRIYILDAQLQPVPIGVAGEIYIGGAGVARGYLNRPELTAERFVPDCVSGEVGARLYKTGDLARWSHDGTIEYIGRNDDQVKIRGYRIELGEIEKQITAHPDIEDAAVIAREYTPGDKRLIAYLVPRRAGAAVDVDNVRTHLKTMLPDYMVPAIYMCLDALPLTSHGKIDRRALPAPEPHAVDHGHHAPPIGDQEQALAELWSEILGVSVVSRTDSFFELGGHSLAAVSLVVKVNERWGCGLRVVDVYRNPTLRELAEQMRGCAVNEEFVNLETEAVLEDDIRPSSGAVALPARNVLLTGATGFVGRFLLEQLLREPKMKAYCLVRARSAREGFGRLRNTLMSWDLWREEFATRIVAVPGDLRQPRLGLDESTYLHLAETVDVIFHCGTSMNHLETYKMAKAANVLSATEILRLATLCRPMLVNYVSTLGVFSSDTTGAARVVDEDTSAIHERHHVSRGYTASKWVAEQVFLQARARGIPCNIFRLGLVWADGEQGRFDELQQVYRVLKSSLLSGFGIEGHHYDIPPIPVDFVARAMALLGGRQNNGRGVFHLCSNTQMSAGVFERCNEITGAGLTLVPAYDWVQAIKQLHAAGQSLPAVPLIEYAFNLDEDAFYSEAARNRAAAIRFDSSQTLGELANEDLVAPALDDRLLKLCIEDMLFRDPDLQGRRMHLASFDTERHTARMSG